MRNALGVPKLGTGDYIDLNAIAQISRFRSAEGHSYTDDFEPCRSMKHYLRWKYGVSGGTIRIFSPVDGKIAYVRPEQMFGMQVGITPTSRIRHRRPRESAADSTPTASTTLTILRR